MASKAKRGRPAYFDGERMTYCMRTMLDRSRMDLYDAAAARAGVHVSEWVRNTLDIAAEGRGAPKVVQTTTKQIPLPKTKRIKTKPAKPAVGADGMNAQERARQKSLPGIKTKTKSNDSQKKSSGQTFAQRMAAARAAKKVAT